MRHFLVLTAVLFAGACVSYEEEPGLRDTAGGGEEPSEDTADTAQSEEIQLSFQPIQAEQGEVFIGYITDQSGEMDLSQVDEIKFYGDVEVLDWNLHNREMVASLVIPLDAVTGSVDLLLTLDEQQALFLDNALTIYPKDSGYSADDGYAPPSEDSTSCE